jgi:hypothetical protein
MDRYVENPRAPGTYRALAGLGDPDFMAESPGQPSNWQAAYDEQQSAQTLFGIESYGDCRAGYAMKTYRERSARLGAGSAYVDQWLKVQRAVFTACKGGGDDRQAEPLPPPAIFVDADLARLQRADRAYQAASQAFYRSQIVEARAAFAAIAAQKGPAPGGGDLHVSGDRRRKPGRPVPAGSSEAGRDRRGKGPADQPEDRKHADRGA